MRIEKRTEAILEIEITLETDTREKKNRLHFFDGNSDRVSTEHFNRGTPTKWKSLSWGEAELTKTPS